MAEAAACSCEIQVELTSVTVAVERGFDASTGSMDDPHPHPISITCMGPGADSCGNSCRLVGGIRRNDGSSLDTGADGLLLFDKHCEFPACLENISSKLVKPGLFVLLIKVLPVFSLGNVCRTPR
jgi:hypothetical protein